MPTTLNSPQTGLERYVQSIREVADLMGIPAGTIVDAKTDSGGTNLMILLEPAE